jgi:hypothetical protein
MEARPARYLPGRGCGRRHSGRRLLGYPVLARRPAQGSRNRPGYRVQVQTEITICTDRAEPGGTEEWADAFYYDDPVVHKKLGGAERAARQLAEQYAAGRVHVTGWDGLSLSIPAADLRRGR